MNSSGRYECLPGEASVFPYSVSCVLLAYREEENLKILLPKAIDQLRSSVADFEIIVVDSAEALDGTPLLCEQLEVRYVNQEYPFFGGAMKTAIDSATKQCFLILDADCSCDPKDIPLLLDCMASSNCDMVIGSRYVQGGISNGTKLERAMSGLLNGAFRKALDVDVRDISIDFRLYKTDDLRRVTLCGENYDILEEVVLKLKIQKEIAEERGNFVIREVPIEFSKRAHGESKRKLVKFVLNYLKTLIKLWSLRRLCMEKRKSWRAEEPKAELISNAFLYFIIGCLGALLDFAVFSFVLLITGWQAPDTVFQFVGLAELANIAGAFAGSLLCFRLNAFYNFMVRDHLFARYLSYAVVVLMGTCLSTAIMFFLRASVNVHIVKVLCVSIGAILQFVLNRAITFRKAKKHG